MQALYGLVYGLGVSFRHDRKRKKEEKKGE